MWKITPELNLPRVKKLFCYDFLTEEDVAANPLKVLFLNDCLGMYDWSTASKFFLDKGVSGLDFFHAPRSGPA